MPETLAGAIRRTRSKLDEASTAGGLWTNTELTDWINDGLRDMARRAEDILDFNTSIAIVAGTSKYPLPGDVVRIHRAEFAPTGQQQTYPIALTTHEEMDGVWGATQSTQGTPAFMVVWGFAGGTGTAAHQIQLYPVPAQNGVINLFYFRLPYRFLDPVANAGELAKVLECVEGWDDLVVQYAFYQGLKKDRDPRWQEEKQEYEEKLQDLIHTTRSFHDQGGFITSATGSYVPSWLYEFEG